MISEKNYSIVLICSTDEKSSNIHIKSSNLTQEK